MSVRRRLAIITGINRYSNNIPPLSSAVRDAEAVGRVLKDIHGYELELYLDEVATLARLRELFSGLSARLHEDDWVVVYFAGHGIAESADSHGPTGYFIPVDADRDHVETFLPMAEVQAALDQIKSKHLLVLLDCCFAGAFKWARTRAVMGRPKKLYKERYERYLREPARQVLTSSASNETALDVVSGKVIGARDVGEEHSPFAGALIRALRDSVADVGFDGAPGDGVTTATELHLYIESVMGLAEKGLGRAVQKPMIWQIDDRSQGEFLFERPGHQANLPSALELSEENNPYRGLRAYDEEHAALFFGRAELTVALAEAVASRALTVVVGGSGSGKSSLVKAGLAWHLKRTATRWAVLPPVRPGDAPDAALHAAAAALCAWPDAPGSTPSAPSAPSAGPPPARRLADAVRAHAQRHPGVGALLIVDQLEELVTMAAGRGALEAFFAELGEGIAAGLRVVATLRSDFEPHFDELLSRNPGARFPIRPMNRAELREVIEGPAAERVLDFNPPELVDVLIDEVIDSPGALPLLSFTLSELYRARLSRDATDRSLTREDYDRLGGVIGSLGARADRIFDGLPDDAHRQTMSRVLLRLVSIKGGDVARRRVPMREIVSEDEAETARAMAVLRALSEARLVVETREERPRAPLMVAPKGRWVRHFQPTMPAPERPEHVGVTFEAAHDKLVTGWRRLWEILGEHREDMLLVPANATAAEEWEANGAARDRLWAADPRLPLLEDLLKRDPLRFNALEAAFVRASRRRRVGRLVTLAVVVLIVFAALSSTALWALWSRNQARVAREKASYSRLVAEAGRPELYVTQEQALLLSVEAARHEESVETDAILRAVQDRGVSTERVMPVGDAKVSAVDWSRAGPRRVVAGGANREVVLFDGVSGAERARVGLAHAVHGLAFSPTGDRVLAHTGEWRSWALLSADADQLAAAASGDLSGAIVGIQWREDGREALILDEHGINVLTQKDEIRTVPLPHLLIAEGQLLPGGREALICGQDAVKKTGYAAVYSLFTGEVAWVIRAGGDPIARCAVSAGGRWFATTNTEGAELWDREAPGAPGVSLGGGEVSVFAFDHAADHAGESSYLAAGTTAGAVAMWHVTQRENKCLMNGHEAGVSSLAWSSDDLQLLSASADRTSILWDTTLGTLLSVLSGHDQPVTDAALDPEDDHRVASASEDGTVRIFKIGQPYPRVFGWVEQDVLDATLSPSGDAVALVRESGAVEIYPRRPPALKPGQIERATASLRPPGARALTARFCGDADTLVVRDEDRHVRLLQVSTGAQVGLMDGRVGPDTLPMCSADGRFVAAYSASGAFVWARETGAQLGGGAPVGALSGVAWNPTQNAIALWGGESSSHVLLVGPGVTANRGPLPGVTGEVHAIAWSHDGRRLAVADDGGVGGESPRILIFDDVLSRLAEAPSHVLSLEAFSKTTDLAWSPDDAHLVSVSATLGQIWDTGDWSRRRELVARELRQVVWSPARSGDDGRGERVATVDAHGVLRLFEPRTGALVAQINVPESTVRRVSFTPDGADMLALLSDDTARVLSVYQDALVAQLCDRAVRNFTRSEWLRFVADEPYRVTCAGKPAFEAD